LAAKDRSLKKETTMQKIGGANVQRYPFDYFPLAQDGKVDLVFLFDDPIGGEIFSKQTQTFAQTKEFNINTINHPNFNSF
jgi:hypothetical protein